MTKEIKDIKEKWFEQDGQIAKINQELISRIQSEINKPFFEIEYNSSYNDGDTFYNIFFGDNRDYTDYQIVKSNLDFDIEKLMSRHSNNRHPHKWNYEEINNLVSHIENKKAENCLAIIHSEINSLQNGYLAIIDAIEDKNKEIIDDLNLKIDEQKRVVQLDFKELEESNRNLELLKSQLSKLDKQIIEYEKKLKIKFDWKEVIKNKRKSLQSTEDFLSLTLRYLEEKYLNLEHKNNSKEELIIIQNNKLNDYIRIANSLEERINILTNDLENSENLLMDAHSEIASLEATKIRLNNKIVGLENELEKYKSREEFNKKFFADWQDDQDKATALREEERARQKLTIWENGQLKNQIERIIKGSLDERNYLANKLDLEKNKTAELTDKLNNNCISLTNSEETIKQLKRAKLISELKLIGVLAVDTTRFFMPGWYSFLVSSFETTILVGELTGIKKIQAGGWLSLIIISLLAAYAFIRILIVKFLQILIISKNTIINDKDEVISLWNIWNIRAKKDKNEKEIIDIQTSENKKLK